jgi:hypothetical protein
MKVGRVYLLVYNEFNDALNGLIVNSE